MKKRTTLYSRFTMFGLLSALLLTGCGLSPKTGQPINDTKPIASQESSGFRYRDPKYGYTVDFPQSWVDWEARHRILEWEPFGKSDSVDFGLPEYPSLFNISAHTKEQWNQIQTMGNTPPTFMGERRSLIFGWTQAQNAENGEMEKRLEEVKAIIKTVELNPKPAGGENAQ